jgi:hypothetical protein
MKLENNINKYRFIALYTTLWVICFALFGCGTISAPPGSELPTSSKGYVVYVLARKTEVIIDFSKKDGLSRGTMLDVFRMEVPGMDEPVKLGEITVEKVGDKMSRAKVTAITSSLQMERGDRVFPHPIIVASDGLWLTSKTPIEGWKSDTSLGERDWEKPEVLSIRNLSTPEIRQLLSETDVKPIWHPSVTSRYGDVFFRKVFNIDAKITEANIKIACGGRTNIYLNDKWVGEADEWPDISNFKVHTYLKRGKNLIAVHTIREPRSIHPPALFLVLTVKTEFR